MLNPLQTTLTHAEPVFDTFSAALGRSLRAIGYAVEAAGMVPRGKARASYVSASSSGHAFPLVVVSCVASGPDLPEPAPEGIIGQHAQLDPHGPVWPDGLLADGSTPDDHRGCGCSADPARRPAPDLEADGYSWGPNARDLLYAGLADTPEPPC